MYIKLHTRLKVHRKMYIKMHTSCILVICGSMKGTNVVLVSALGLWGGL